MDEKLSPQEFATKVKSKYPEYKDIDDVTLAQRVIEKYPEYADRVSMDEGGLSQQPTRMLRMYRELLMQMVRKYWQARLITSRVGLSLRLQ
jgi:hypothetical protein